MRDLLIACCLLAGCHDWRDQVDPSQAALDPVQTPIEGAEPVRWTERGNVIELVPRAHYEVRGYVIELSRQLLDEWDFVIPLDLGLAWGSAADPAVLKTVDFHLSGRYLSWRTRNPSALNALRGHVANNHLIPRDEAVKEQLDRLRIGQLVTLRGQLVDLEIRSEKGHLRHRNKSSLKRDDEGSGACEQLWVEAVEIEASD